MRIARVMMGALLVAFLAACGSGSAVDNPLYPGQTDFVTSEPENGSGLRGDGSYAEGAPPPMAAGGATTDTKNSGAPGAPSGRTGTVEEADIYRVAGGKLFYLNTYKGFLIYDLQNPKQPLELSRLGVYGYPIEMFIQNNTVYALLRDALYLTEVKGTLQFERHNVSQLVSIDISDLKNPKVLQTVDITGELREGVSRKIEDTIYVVSYLSRYYWYGWNYGSNQQEAEQAWVYSFNVKDPKALKLVQKLKVFEGGGYSVSSGSGTTPGGGTATSYASRYFQDVTISATSNVLMVVENWYTSGYVSGSPYSCGNYTSQQQAIVSLIDISDPAGAIRLHTRLETYGHLGDQFKQTYLVDEKTKVGTYLGIFARQEWTSNNCSGGSFIRNTLESWDVTDGSKPTRLDSLAFGKENETVRGSVFDPARSVAFAITARNVDPLYALSYADPKDLKILSAIDGLSGDMSVFRFISDNKFLMAIGRDNSDACTGFASASTGFSTNVAVSIIDVQDLSAIKLVQRKCVAVNAAGWVSSELNWNLDQAHKMLGMFSDAGANVITVPVYYWKKVEDGRWWYSNYETAVGMMTWDLTKYDPLKQPQDQQVLTNFGTIIHPKGEVKRTVVFRHEALNRRMVMNLSQTHISILDIENLAAPALQSIVEVAPYYSELYRFGDYMVEHILPQEYHYYGQNQLPSEFRVKKTGGQLDGAPVVASFIEGQVERVVPFKDNLILFRRIYLDPAQQKVAVDPYYSWKAEAVVYSLKDPRAPKKLGTVELPGGLMPDYYYWCGTDFGFFGGYRFGGYYNYYGTSSTWTTTDAGPVFLSYVYDSAAKDYKRKLTLVNFSDLAKPVVQEYPLSSSVDLQFFNLVNDPSVPGTFYLSYRTQTGKQMIAGASFVQFRYYAQRYTASASGLQSGPSINLPGRLARVLVQGPSRQLLTHDFTYRQVVQPQSQYPMWQNNYRLNLLEESSMMGKPAARLLDSYLFSSTYLKDLVVDGSKLFINSRPDYVYQQVNHLRWDEVSDRLTIFDLSGQRFNKTYEQPTGTYSVELMGTYKGQLFLNLPGDGILMVNVSNPSVPFGQRFMRTLGYATHLEFAGDTAYAASGYFGVFQMSLGGASAIPTS